MQTHCEVGGCLASTSLIFNSEYAKEVFMRDRKNPVEYAEYLQNLIDKWVNCSNLTATTDKTVQISAQKVKLFQM